MGPNTSSSVSHPGVGSRSWENLVDKLVSEVPVLQTRRPRAGIERLSMLHGCQAVQVGLGIKDRHGLTEAVPLDMLELLLTAERLRQIVCPGGYVDVLIADTHAERMGSRKDLVAERAQELREVVQRSSEALGIPVRAALASELHASHTYCEVRAFVSERLERAANGLSEYTILELALRWACGPQSERREPR